MSRIRSATAPPLRPAASSSSAERWCGKAKFAPGAHGVGLRCTRLGKDFVQPRAHLVGVGPIGRNRLGAEQVRLALSSLNGSGSSACGMLLPYDPRSESGGESCSICVPAARGPDPRLIPAAQTPVRDTRLRRLDLRHLLDGEGEAVGDGGDVVDFVERELAGPCATLGICRAPDTRRCGSPTPPAAPA